MEIVKFTCHSCGEITKIRLLDEYRGKNIKVPCRKCKTSLKQYIPKTEKISEIPDNKEDIKGKRKKPGFGRIVVQESLTAQKQSFFLNEGLYVVGRKVSSLKIDIPIDTTDKCMSRRHCQIQFRTNPETGLCFYTIREIDSKNKIILNDKLMEKDEELILADGDKIILGTTVIVFETSKR